jgi:hypothetical protein
VTLQDLTVTNNGTLRVDNDQTLTLDGTTIDGGAHGTVSNAGTLDSSGTTEIGVTFNNTGTVNVDSGTLDLAGGISNNGELETIGGTLDFASAVSGTGTVAFDGSSGTIEIVNPVTFSSAISGVIAGDNNQIMDLGGLNAGSSDSFTVSATYNSSTNETTLAVTDTTNDNSQSVLLVGNESDYNWSAIYDGHGGAYVADPPATSVSATAATVAAAGTLTIDAPSSDTVTFAGSTGTLVIDQPNTFSGQIENFTGTAPNAADSDVIDLVGINYNSGDFTYSYNATTGVLTVSDGTNTATLTFVNFTGTFQFASDGDGGTDVFDPPAANSSSSSNSINQDQDHFIFHPGSDNGAVQHGGTDIYEPSTANSPGSSVKLSQGQIDIGGSGKDQFIFQPGMGSGAASNVDPQRESIPIDHFSTPESTQQLTALLTTDVHGVDFFDPGHADSNLPGGWTAAQFHQLIQGAVHLH